MILALVLAGVLAPCVVALLALAPLVRERAIGRCECLAAAIALGLGVSSAAFFLWRLTGASPRSYVAFELVVAAAIVAVFLFRHRSGAPVDLNAGYRESAPEKVLAAIGIVIVLAMTVLLASKRVVELPQGDWDAWAIWNLRAAFLADASAHWADGFTTALAWSHPDYPLHVPASVARLWTFAGELTPAAPIAYAMAVLVAIVLATTGALLRVGGHLAAAAGAALLLVPEFTVWATSQQADVPLGLFLLLALATVIGRPSNGQLTLAGLFSAMAAWTKNEGAVVAVMIPAASTVVAALRHGRGEGLRTLKFMALGSALPLLTLAIFRASVSPAPALVTLTAGAGPLEKLMDPSRHEHAVRVMSTYVATQWGGWHLAKPAWIAAGLLVLGITRRVRPHDAVVAGFLAALAIPVAYYVVYVVTPYDQTWHLTTSWPRLFAQLWPTIIWVAIAIQFPAEQATLPVMAGPDPLSGSNEHQSPAAKLT